MLTSTLSLLTSLHGTLSEHGITDGSQLHLVVRLGCSCPPCSPDDHPECWNSQPRPGARDVPLNTTVSCRMDASVLNLPSVMSEDLIQLHEGCLDGPEVAGAPVVDLASRIITFTPRDPLHPATEYHVRFVRRGSSLEREVPVSERLRDDGWKRSSTSQPSLLLVGRSRFTIFEK
jgi:hypothetical protein